MAIFYKKNRTRERAKHGAMAGYIEQLTYSRPVKVLTQEEIAKLYPGVEINLEPLNETERAERDRMNVKASNKQRYGKKV